MPKDHERIVDSASWARPPAGVPEAPLVSLVVSAYNYERYVEEMLRSLEAQTYPKVEIIVVHDGGTDRTLEIAERFVQQTWRPARLIDQPNAGMVKAIQRGFREARGEWVTFFDADDVMLPDKTEKQVRQAREHGVDAVIGSFLWLDETGKTYPYPEAPEFTDHWDAEAFVRTLVSSRGPMFTAGLFRRDLLARIGGPDQGLPMNDWPFMVRYARAARRLLVTTEPVFLYRKHAASHSTARMRQLLDWKLRTIDALCSGATAEAGRARAYRLVADDLLAQRKSWTAWRFFRKARRHGPQDDEAAFRRDVRWLLRRQGFRGRLLRRLVPAKA